MPYATRSDIEQIYGARQLLTLLAKDVDPDVAVARAIAAAEAMINPYLRKRYLVPLPVIPGIVQQCAIDIACWQLAPAADRMSEQIEKRAKLRLDFLKDVAAGKADIVELEGYPAIGDGGSNAQSGSGAAFFVEDRRYPPGGGLL
ncbi:hypothetical protein GCM10019059_34890 [Camelimonas fluminis]|uniref:Phage protein Gp36 family protein n=1 Tax=Camelimonas fluminis TaxID=1576911 RepID=A0ABV7UGQ7_9HYPH|nr:DUF1320 domain-containing protein [Camelimonas fluminis]GHE72281.1 hypothetical protein GCM10019059_34890 [Camelimonas fluminis]